MTTNRVLACLTVIVTVGLCSAAAVGGQDVAYSAVCGTDFTKFKTYAWGDITQATQIDPVTDAQIRRAVEGQLAAKRLTRTEGPSDLWVVYDVTPQPQQETLQSASDMGVGNGSSIRYTTTSRSTEAITVGLYDRTAKRLVWRGGATKAVQETRQKDVDAVVGKLFKHYPPREK